MSIAAVKNGLGWLTGFNKDLQQANAVAATAQKDAADAKAELTALKEQQAVKDAAAKVEADARAAAVQRAEEKRNQVEAQAVTYADLLERLMPAAKAGVSGAMEQLESIHNQACALKSGYGSSIHNNKFHEVMGAAREILLEKANGDVAKANAQLETARANLRAEKIEEFRSKYYDAIESATASRSLKHMGALFTLGVAYLFVDNIGQRDTDIKCGLEKARDCFVELVKDESKSPEEAFKQANDKHVVYFKFS